MIRHRVRTTMRPDKEIEVTGTELADLDAQGLVAGSRPVDEVAAAPWTPPAPQPEPAASTVPTTAAMDAAAEARTKPTSRTRKTSSSGSGGGSGAAASKTDSAGKEE